MKPCFPVPKNRTKAFAAICFLLAVSMFSTYAQTGEELVLNTALAESRAYVDWAREKLHIILTAPVDSGEGKNRTTLLNRKEAEVSQLFPSLFPYFLSKIRIDSTRTYDDLIRKDPVWFKRLASLQDKAVLLSSKPAKDLKSITMEYLFTIKPLLCSPLIDFDQAMELEKILDWHPKAEYSGLVIHAEGKLPWFGTDRLTTLETALFPRILDEDGRVVLQAGNLIPLAAKRWGSVAYSSEVRPELQSDRAGDHPYTTIAKALFGDAPTDLVISRNDATMLLYNDSTRRALKEGRIIVVVDKETLNQASDN